MAKKNVDNLIITNEKKNKTVKTVLKKLIKEADEVWILMAFITEEGFNEIWNELKNKTVKIITSFFYFSNKPKMFEDLNEKQFNISNSKKNKWNFECRIWEDSEFHPKVFIFVKNSLPFKMLVGSSNLTISGLVENFEINTLINLNSSELANKIRDAFLKNWWQNQKAIPLNQEWIDWYCKKRIDKKTYETYMQINKERNRKIRDFENILKNVKLSVWKSQDPALHDLIRLYKAKKRKKGILVLATGLGKTHTAAFFCKLMSFERVLFLAPKQEILIKAREVFLSVFSNKLEWNNSQFVNKYDIQKKLTERKRIDRDTFQLLFQGQKIDLSKMCCLFATYKSWKKKVKNSTFTNINFDIVIVDEAHHTLASEFFGILQSCKLGKEFEILGLTATDFRTNFSEMLKLWEFYTPLNFKNYLIHKVTIINGIKNKDLCKFHYYAIKVDTLENKISDEEFDQYLFGKPKEKTRVQKKLVKEYVKQINMVLVRNKIRELQKNKKIKALIFCINIEHAENIYTSLNHIEDGIAELIVSKNTDKNDTEKNKKRFKELRKTIIKEFESETSRLEFIVTVNIYNEGVDIPFINTVIFLRPTDSPIVFIQQLGRGLRYQDNKALLILDFVRNEKTLINNLQLLSGHYILTNEREYIKEAREVVKLILKYGCTINTGLIDMQKIDITSRLDYTSFFSKKELLELPSKRNIQNWLWKTTVSGKKPTLSFLNECYPYPPLFPENNKEVQWLLKKTESNNVRLQELWDTIKKREPFRFYSDIHILKHVINSNFTKVYANDLLDENKISVSIWKKYLLAFANLINKDALCKYNEKKEVLEFFNTKLLKNDKEFKNYIDEVYNYFKSIFDISYQGKKFNTLVHGQVYKLQDIHFFWSKTRSNPDISWLHIYKRDNSEGKHEGYIRFKLKEGETQYLNKINENAIIRFPGPNHDTWKQKNYKKDSFKYKFKHNCSILSVFIELKGFYFYVGDTDSKNIKEIDTNLFELKLDRPLSQYLIDLFLQENVLYTKDWVKKSNL